VISRGEAGLQGVRHSLGHRGGPGEPLLGERGFSWPCQAAISSQIPAPEDQWIPLIHPASLIRAGVSAGWSLLGHRGVSSSPDPPEMEPAGRTCSVLAAEQGCGRRNGF